MKNFWKAFGTAALNSALQGAAQASQSGTSVKDTGIAAGLSSIIGILQFLVQHPAAQAPAVQAVVVSQAKVG